MDRITEILTEIKEMKAALKHSRKEAWKKAAADMKEMNAKIHEQIKILKKDLKLAMKEALKG